MDETEADPHGYRAEDDNENPPIPVPGPGEEQETGVQEPRSENACISCLRGSWHLISWLWSILTYLAELFAIGWVAWLYATRSYYILLSITLAYVAPPTIVLMVVSLVWYADLDRFYRKQQENGQSENPFVKQYKKRLTIATVIVHVMSLGVIFR